MQPTEKDPAIDDLIDKVFKVNRKSRIRASHCVSQPMGCGLPVTGFDDQLSENEYTISGLCQSCQDRIFK